MTSKRKQATDESSAAKRTCDENSGGFSTIGTREELRLRFPLLVIPQLSEIQVFNIPTEEYLEEEALQEYVKLTFGDLVTTRRIISLGGERFCTSLC